MSILKDMVAPPKRVPICKVMAVQDSLEPADEKIFIQAVDNVEEWPTETLWRELKRRGVDIGRETIRAHRRGDCVCVSR